MKKGEKNSGIINITLSKNPAIGGAPKSKRMSKRRLPILYIYIYGKRYF